MSEEMKKVVRQNEVIISLLGRIAFTPEQVSELVVSRKKDNLKQKYVDGYNALNGRRSLSQIAKIVGVTRQTIAPILLQWEELGIIYEIERAGGKFYKKLFPI